MRRPSFQFYPDTWLGNLKLKRCSHAEKGMWIDIMCLMHDSDQYGVLRWALSDIAQAIGTDTDKLTPLVAKGVLKGANEGRQCEALVYVPRHGRKNGNPITLIEEQLGPIWYSSRMVIDEYVRVIVEKNLHSRRIKSPNGEAKGAPNGEAKGAPNGEAKGAPNGEAKGAHPSIHPRMHLSEDEDEDEESRTVGTKLAGRETR